MADSFSDWLQQRGASGVLVIYSTQSKQRFTDRQNGLIISPDTLSKRIGEARDHGLFIEGMTPKETSVKQEYRIAERGGLIVRQVKQLGIVHTYRSLLDIERKLEEQEEELTEWVGSHRE